MPTTDDVLAIQRTALDFAFAVAAKDCAAIGATFAEQGALTNMSAMLGREDVEIVGPDAVRALFESVLPHMAFVHPMVQTRVLAVDGDRASAETMILETMCGPDQKPLSYFARYQDELVRTEDGWRFLRRTGHPSATVTPPAQVRAF